MIIIVIIINPSLNIITTTHLFFSPVIALYSFSSLYSTNTNVDQQFSSNDGDQMVLKLRIQTFLLGSSSSSSCCCCMIMMMMDD